MLHVAQFARFGPPAEAVTLATAPPTTALAPQQVRVQMLFAPINPADLNYIEGTYGIRPELPATPGIEGSARVIAIGSEVQRVALDDIVLVLAPGNWCSERTLPESDLIALPPGIDPIQAAMLKVNPLTALLMLRSFVSLHPGETLLQNAANSGVGRCVIQLARHFGWRTVNLLRRIELADELSALGADEIHLDEETSVTAHHWQIRLALNAVGGDSALRLAGCLADGGCLVTYGAMGRKALKVPNSFLIFRDHRYFGFWLNRTLKAADPTVVDAWIAELAQLIPPGSLRQPVHAILPLTSLTQAITLAQEPARSGKVLLDLRTSG